MNIDFEKGNGLIPAIIQDNNTGKVLMLGYMNQEAYDKTVADNTVTFFSRTKNRLWTKGEESGNFLHIVSITNDCDNDTLLIKVNPVGPVCHTGADTCWDEQNQPVGYPFIQQLSTIIKERKNALVDTSYTAQLFAKGINKIAQKVGEEAVEIVIEAKDNNDELFLGEAADLLFHYMVLLEAKGFSLHDVEELLKKRHTK
ncbi:MAG: bifunctional phosphoribosyl-AMP cyclohydrolase/phosphoribosyl-ATP diphosphatase HisIE [Sphingobacteriales bacterium JAD_PAG50586_3]|nr:MAG: bifunctional phosphoribosyl-AMP cyclohydrolase/phosphoribosyl-ATP diphosphatase HisIE [Sphingobacteriales bacterium JAD_PAG50586_3]